MLRERQFCGRGKGKLNSPPKWCDGSVMVKLCGFTIRWEGLGDVGPSRYEQV